jgi:chorismate mutase
MTTVRGLRGATTADSNTRDAILESTRELLEALVEANNVSADDIAAVTFSTTRDLDAEFPAVAARVGMGWTEVAMMCGHEMEVPGGQERCIRVMMLVNTDKAPHDLKRIYLREAASLRARSGKADRAEP